MSERIYRKSPCKINVMLAITGTRPDGFHELLSIVLPTKFGDEIACEFSDNGRDEIICNMDGIPKDSSNLAIKAAELFRKESGLEKFFKFDLKKNVPAGAGLGGGSSNGAIALLEINELCGNPINLDKLERIAAQMGSDCPLFLKNCPVVMRGRGEKVYELAGEASETLKALDLVIFKPAFSINTGWAYSQMRANPSCYISPDKAENTLSEWLENPASMPLPLVNNMQIPAFEKFPALDIALGDIRAEFRIPTMMSGSGSACFAVVNGLSESKIGELESLIKSRLGDSCLVVRA